MIFIASTQQIRKRRPEPLGNLPDPGNRVLGWMEAGPSHSGILSVHECVCVCVHTLYIDSIVP